MNKVFNIGEYDRRFLFERKNIATNPIGNAQTAQWETITTLWGKFKNIPSKEVFEAQQQVAINTIEIQTRWAANIDETCRFTDVIYGGTYEISNVDANKREDFLIIRAVKRDNQ